VPAGGLDANAMRRIGERVTTRRRLKRGEGLYRAADLFTALYAIRVGTWGYRATLSH